MRAPLPLLRSYHPYEDVPALPAPRHRDFRRLRLAQQYFTLLDAVRRTPGAAGAPRPPPDLSARRCAERYVHGNAHPSARAPVHRKHYRLDAGRVRRWRRHRRIRRPPDDRRPVRRLPRLGARLPDRWPRAHARSCHGRSEATRRRLRLHGRRRQDLPPPRQGRRADAVIGRGAYEVSRQALPHQREEQRCERGREARDLSCQARTRGACTSDGVRRHCARGACAGQAARRRHRFWQIAEGLPDTLHAPRLVGQRAQGMPRGHDARSAQHRAVAVGLAAQVPAAHAGCRREGIRARSVRGGFGSTGIDDLGMLAELPAGYAGGIWTNRIDRIGTAARATASAP
jgi:hypothetical protein